MVVFLLFLFSFLLQIPTAFAYKILIYSPSVSNSHLISCARVADVLATDGHDVTLLEVEIIVPLVNNFSKNANVLRVFGPFFHADFGGNDFQKIMTIQAFDKPNAHKRYNVYKNLQISSNKACEKFVTSQPGLIKSLREQKFDMVIEEQLNFCGAGLGHLLNIPIHVLVSSCPMQEHVASLFGLPFPSSYVPSLLDSDYSDKMSISERFDNILRTIAGNVFLWHGIDPLTEIFRKHYGSDFPDLRDIVKSSPFVFVNVDELLDFPRPLFPNMINIGGLGMGKSDQNAKLEEPFQSEMSKGKDGIIFVSLGTIIRSSDLPTEFRRNFLETFGKFAQYHFIMKTEKGDNHSVEIAAKFGNIFLTHWAPQNAILAHPRLKLFITHGGYNSLMEAARCGVPVLSTGFFADQYRNSRAAERNGWARTFDKVKLLRGNAQFESTIGEMLKNSKYAVAAKRIQNLIKTKPFSAEERLLKNIRFLEQNDGKLPELLSESQNMSAIALYNIDLAIIGIVLLAFTFAVTFFVCKRILRTLAQLVKKMGGERRPKKE
uniref:glucuronosyltransferase n=1 Tax=Globodera rostochiensis TaxID=31243 RepID=A0A914HUB8_GLORO